MVKRAQANDTHAWECLIDRYARLVWSVVRSYGLLPHDAQDAEQTVWFNLAENLDRLRAPERVGAWLATTAHYECRKQMRLARRTAPTDPAFLERPGGGDPESLHIDAERARQVRRAIAGLSEPDRTVAALELYAPRAPAADVADFAGLESEQVAGIRRRVRRRLRRMLTDEYEWEGA
ncbi:RNA polymerase sigma factor (sigma-70 family) [Lipingzhangella halophila]|uniref:RNA polymerase sigma factor (Sigma-70 family) n=1 Tax=Lipingzhangella halophila TaxID=1783352 RepID=A0A7W7RJB7_9ACTN|nr:sigma-70 family RNA polymerase sigma factor [Lipingzhangella halophila]MBB4933064.1 RNA polymerase sigma factor (sigma-70 family) [Lipingzhangella halophila]